MKTAIKVKENVTKYWSATNTHSNDGRCYKKSGTIFIAVSLNRIHQSAAYFIKSRKKTVILLR